LASLRAIPAWAALAALVVVSTLLRWWAASKVPTPWIVPDEVLYAKLGQSLWSDGSFQLLGKHVGYFSLVYPALVGLPLSLHDLALGYELLKPLQAFVMSLAAVPVYLWGRSLVSKWWAVSAAALTLTIPGLAYSGLVMSEVAFYPISALALWAAAAALARPSPRNQLLVVGAVLLASATRLQGVVLAAVFATAVLLLALFERDARKVLRFWPSLAGFAAIGIAWAVWRLSAGGPASELFGGYRAAGETHYTVANTLRFARFHLTDIILMTGLIPACAVAVLAVAAFAGRERSREARAYLAVAVSLVAWLALEVGLFASVHVHRLAERDLLAVCPALFLGFALWLDRGAPRPRLVTALVGAAALGLVLWLPVGRLVSHAAIPDAFMAIPLWRLQVRRPDIDLQLVVDLIAVVAVLAFALWPRRHRWGLPVALGLVLAVASFSVGRVVASEATIVRITTLGDTPRWIDESASGPVSYVYSGEATFTSVWETLFWNRKLKAVYRLLNAKVPLLDDDKQPSIGPEPDGRLILADGTSIDTPYAVASFVLGFDGRQRASAFGPALVLWQAHRPLALSTWLLMENAGNGVFSRVRMVVYGCRGGRLRLRLTSPVAQTVSLRAENRPLGGLKLQPGKSVEATVTAPPPTKAGDAVCQLAVRPKHPLAVDNVRFLANRPRR
jgi:hypothetical protein